MDAFPYPPRPGQADLVAHLAAAVREGSHAVAESGTGTGKTVCALAAVLPEAQALGKRVLYLVRTNAQERQVMLEFRRVAPLLARPASAVALQGRSHLCPLRAEDPAFAEASSEELAVMCRDRVKAAQDEGAGKKPRFVPCRFFAATHGDDLADLVLHAKADTPTAEELVERAAGAGMCPYYVSRALLADATLVAAPYVWFTEPWLRRALLEWMGVAIHDLVVVVDEAHNLPDHARDALSAHLGRHGVVRALREVEEFGDRALPTPQGTMLAEFLERLGRVVDGLAVEFLEEDDALVPPDAFDAEILAAMRSTTRTWDRVAAALLGYGEEVRESRRRAGRVPRSYVGAVGRFLVAYRESEPDLFLRLVERGDDGPRLALACLDASLAVTPLLECHATVHLSGTLAPLEAYRDAVGLPAEETELAALGSPFPRENRLVLVDGTVTTRHAEVREDPDAWARLGRRLAEVRAAASGRNAAVFAPSFDAAERLRGFLPRDAFVEVRGAGQKDLMGMLEEFKRRRGATLLAVAGGRVAEGLDFPGGELELVVVAGLPYPKPTARLKGLERFFDARFGRGFEYAVEVPTLRRTLQAVGRLIRAPDDRGVAVLLDRRGARLARHLPDLATDAAPAERAAAFFARSERGTSEGGPGSPKH